MPDEKGTASKAEGEGNREKGGVKGAEMALLKETSLFTCLLSLQPLAGRPDLEGIATFFDN
jgi:hypothetical protein